MQPWFGIVNQTLLSTFSGTVRKRNCYFFPLVFTTSSFVLLLNLFMPSEAPLPLAAILVPIETFAVFFKPVALGVRLFANTTAGLVLFKMAVAAAYFLIASSG